MKLETFFEKFDQFADASDAVVRMRALVLNLAVQGRLVSNSRENPLSAEQIASEKQQRLRELNVRAHPETPQPTRDDFPFSLPQSWHAVALGDLAFSCPTSYGEDPIPSLPKAGVVKVGNIDNQGGFKGHFAERGFLPDEIESLLARRGDLMVVKSSGSAENVHSGKTALCTAEHDGKIVGTNFVLRLRLLGTPALPEYVWRVLTSRYSRAWIEGTVQTMTYPNLKWSDFARLPIPLPPLAEQKRIVAKVDELMALCDRLEAQQQERETRHATLARASLARFADAPTPANLNFLFHESYAIPPADLRKSILTLAVQGKLVPQDPKDEPATSLISQIAGEKRRLVAARIIRDKDEAAPITDDELPFEVPYGWVWTRLSSITRRIHYGYTASAKTELRDVRMLRITDIQNNFVDWASVPGCEIAEEDVAQYKLERGDILVARTGGTVGKTYLVQDVPVVAVFASYLIRIQGGSALFDRYLKIFLESPTYWVQLEEGARGAAQPNVNGQTLGRMVVSVPPLAEQHRIVAKVDQLMALVDELEQQLAASRATGEKLLEALVAELTAA